MSEVHYQSGISLVNLFVPEGRNGLLLEQLYPTGHRVYCIEEEAWHKMGENTFDSFFSHACAVRCGRTKPKPKPKRNMLIVWATLQIVNSIANV